MGKSKEAMESQENYDNFQKLVFEVIKKEKEQAEKEPSPKKTHRL